MPTIKDAKKKQAKRSRRSQLADTRSTSKRVVGQGNTKGITAWMKRPGKLDITGVDSKGRGVTISIRPSNFRK